MSYIGRQPVPEAARYLQEGTLTTPSDEIVVTGGYGVDNIHVFINGVLLPTTEYTANDGLKIVFDAPLPEGTKYMVEEFRTFEVSGLLPEFGTAAMKNVATEAEALAGTPDVLVTAEQTRAVIAQDVPSASDTVAGRVELATSAEAQAGTDTTKAVTPAGLASRTATEARTGLVELATVAEAQAGTDTQRAMTPAGVKSAIEALGFSGGSLQLVWSGSATSVYLSNYTGGTIPNGEYVISFGTGASCSLYIRDGYQSSVTYVVSTNSTSYTSRMVYILSDGFLATQGAVISGTGPTYGGLQPEFITGIYRVI